MKKELWSLDMDRKAFRDAMRNIQTAENAGMTLGRITFDTKTKIISIGIEGTAPSIKDDKIVYPK